MADDAATNAQCDVRRYPFVTHDPQESCMSAIIYGIKNCTTMKKAFDWLAQNHVAYSFHDYKKHGVDVDTLSRWCAHAGWQALINTRGTTWRRLDPTVQAIASDSAAMAVMIEHTSVIRRPVIETPSGKLLIGFDTDVYARELADADAADAAKGTAR